MLVCFILVMVALWKRADHYIFFVWFLSSSSSFFSSPDLSSRTLDVYHTSTHGVALVRISNADLKVAARGSLQMQDPKTSPKIAIWAPSHKFVELYLRNYGMYRQSEKKLLSSNISSTCPYNMVNFGLLAAEILSLVWGTPVISTGFASWQRYCTAL